MRLPVFLLLMAVATQSYGGVNKCTINGTTTYSDKPCPGAAERESVHNRNKPQLASESRSVYRCHLYGKQHKYDIKECPAGSAGPIRFQVVDPIRELNKNAARLIDDPTSHIRFTVSNDGCQLTESVKLSYMTSTTLIPLAQVDLIYIEGFHSHNPGSLMVRCRGDNECIEGDEISDGNRFLSKEGHHHLTLTQMAKSDTWANNVGASLMLWISKCSGP